MPSSTPRDSSASSRPTARWSPPDSITPNMSRATSSSRASTSPTPTAPRHSSTCRCASPAARSPPWWDSPAQARAPSSICSTSSTNHSRAPSASTVTNSLSGTPSGCATTWAWCCRRTTSSTAPLRRTSATAVRRLPTKMW